MEKISSCIKSNFKGPLVGAASTVEREAVHQVRVSYKCIFSKYLCPNKVREVDTDALFSANYIVFVVLLATCALVVILVVTGVVSIHWFTIKATINRRTAKSL